MKTVEITQHGDPEVLKLDERPTSETKAGKVLIRIHAAGVNRPDMFQRTGNYPMPPDASDIPRLEVAGEIVSGDLAHVNNHYGLKVGDRVCALVQRGDYAGFCTAPLGQAPSVSAGLSDVEAAALPKSYFTTWPSVFDRGLLGCGTHGADEMLLAQGGSSGIGAMAIQIASTLGHRVPATAGNASKYDARVKLGAARAIDYRTENFVGIVKAETGPGADVVLDMVGNSCVTREIVCTADNGCTIPIALLGGAKVEVPLGDIPRRHPTLTGSTLRPRPVALRAAITANLYETVWPLLASGYVKPVVHEVVPATQAAQAYTLMRSSAHVGKIMLVWG